MPDGPPTGLTANEGRIYEDFSEAEEPARPGERPMLGRLTYSRWWCWRFYETPIIDYLDGLPDHGISSVAWAYSDYSGAHDGGRWIMSGPAMKHVCALLIADRAEWGGPVEHL
jgi:hypothetical protein